MYFKDSVLNFPFPDARSQFLDTCQPDQTILVLAAGICSRSHVFFIHYTKQTIIASYTETSMEGTKYMQSGHV